MSFAIKLNEILSKYFVDFRLKRMVNFFPFEKEILRCIGEMDVIRGCNCFDKVKRELRVPISPVKIIGENCCIENPTIGQIVESSKIMAECVWGDDRSHDEWLSELIIASNENRHIRIHIPGTSTSVRDIEFEISIVVLVEWIKPRKVRTEYQKLSKDEFIKRMTTEFVLLRESVIFSYRNIVNFIINEGKGLSNSPALIINLDDAQKLGTALDNVLEILVMPILTENLHVFVTITSISSFAFYDIMGCSNVNANFGIEIIRKNQRN